MKKELLLKRVLAFIIDFYVGALFSTMPISIISTITINKMTQNVFLLEKNIAIIAVLISMIVLLIYYFVIPYKVFKGQTIGKKIVGLKINIHGKNYKTSLFKRQVLGYMLLEGSFSPTGKLLFQLFSLISGYNIVSIGTDIGNYIALASIGLLLCGRMHLMIHDYLGNTDVIAVCHEETKKIEKFKEKSYG